MEFDGHPVEPTGGHAFSRFRHQTLPNRQEEHGQSFVSAHHGRAESVVGATTELGNREHELQRVTHRTVFQVIWAARLDDPTRAAVRPHEAYRAGLRDELGRANRMPTSTEEQDVIDLALDPQIVTLLQSHGPLLQPTSPFVLELLADINPCSHGPPRRTSNCDGTRPRLRSPSATASPRRPAPPQRSDQHHFAHNEGDDDETNGGDRRAKGSLAPPPAQVHSCARVTTCGRPEVNQRDERDRQENANDDGPRELRVPR